MKQSPDINPPELLAPAGEMECLRAAIANGADAVYLGGRAFNARMRVANFGPEELAEARELTGRCNVKLYVTMNTLLGPADIEGAARQLEEYAALGVDAVIVQDAGLLELAASTVPALPLFASTQMTLSEPEAIETARRRWGIRRVILPRETSLAELAEIRSHTQVDLEVFVHGAICISYSGQCHASRVAGGRSGNKGQCAQPCRLPWRLMADDAPVPGAPAHVMSPRDLCLVDRLGELWRAGARGFKIEGRAKGAAYVATVVDVYRRALDRVLEGRESPASPADRYALTMSFSRGFTQGYIDGDDPGRLTGSLGPGNMGVRIGRVEQVRGQRVIVRLETPGPEFGGETAVQLRPGDGIALGLPDENGRRTGAAVYEVEPLERGLISLGLDREAIPNVSALQAGLDVWKTADGALDARARQSFNRLEPRRRRRLEITVEARPGAPLVLRCDGAEVTSAQPLAAALKYPLTIELLRAQLGRLGNTAFELGQVTLIGPDGPGDSVAVMAPKSVLNELRRQLVQTLEETGRPRYESRADALTHLRQQADPVAGVVGGSAPSAKPALSVLIRRAEQLAPAIDALRASGAGGRIYLELPFAQLPAAIDSVRAAGLTAALAAPRVFSPSQRSEVERLVELVGAQAMLVRNLGTLSLLRQRQPGMLAVGDASLNITNELAARAMLELGLGLLTPGRDLDLAELPGLLAAMGPGVWELPVYVHEELFFTQHCLWSAHLGNGRPYPQCGRPCKQNVLAVQDARGKSWPVRRDSLGRNTVFDPQVRRLKGPSETANLASIRLELLDESGEQVRRAIESCRA